MADKVIPKVLRDVMEKITRLSGLDPDILNKIERSDPSDPTLVRARESHSLITSNPALPTYSPTMYTALKAAEALLKVNKADAALGVVGLAVALVEGGCENDCGAAPEEKRVFNS